MDDVPFTRPGDYSLSLRVDETEIAQLSFTVNVQDAVSLTPERIDLLLGVGVQAYNAGEFADAEAIFSEISLAQPGSGAALNNLAFVHLTQGKASKALEEFLEAGRLEFDRAELLEANVGCCHYLLAEYQHALDHFERCLKSRPFTSPSILLGIQSQSVFPTHLDSASDYVALMCLNAAWSALMNNDPTLAINYGHRGQEIGVAPEVWSAEQPNRFMDSVKEVVERALGGPLASG
jgi:tetratricopeptide (TPR) repeat protein